jgi:hypothetical protein
MVAGGWATQMHKIVVANLNALLSLGNGSHLFVLTQGGQPSSISGGPLPRIRLLLQGHLTAPS